jgi:microcystin-dependent protein
MASAFAGQIEIFAFPDAPAAWAACNGELLAIAEFATLYQLIGTTYGGDGKTTFAVPNIPPLGANGPFYYICLLGVTAQK